MADEYVQPGGQKYLKWARNRLFGLGQVRAGIGLDTMSKHYVPEPDVRIDVRSSIYGDRIRIFAGKAVNWPKAAQLSSGWGPLQVSANPLRPWEYLGVTAYIRTIGPSSDPGNDHSGAFGLMEGGYVFTNGVREVVGSWDCPALGGLGTFFFAGPSPPIGLIFPRPGGAVPAVFSSFPFLPVGASLIDGFVIALGMQAANRAVAAATFTPWTVNLLAGLAAGIPPSADWQAQMINQRPPAATDDPHPKGVEVGLTFFAPVRSGVNLGAWFTEDPAGVSSAFATEIAVYGTAVFGINYETLALTFHRWEPRRDTAGNIVETTVVPAPAFDWPEYNAIIDYRNITWEPAITQAKQAEKDQRDPLNLDYDPFLWTMLDAIT